MGYIKDMGNGKYQLTVTSGRDVNGKKVRRYKTVSAKSMEAAEAKMEAFIEECEKLQPVSGNNICFSELVAEWREQHAEIRLKKSTIEIYDRLLNEHFDKFKNKRVKDIRHKDVQIWVNSLCRSGMSPKTVRNNYSLMRSIMEFGVKFEYLDKNPADKIDLPASKSTETTSYNDEDVKALLSVLDTFEGHDLTFKVGILLALFGGLRKGEICGLDIGKIDLDHNGIVIDQTRMHKVGYGIITDTPKSDASKRRITIPEGVTDSIKDLLIEQDIESEKLADVWMGSQALLKDEIGAPLSPNTFYKRFKKILKDNDLKDITLHGLRHTHVSMLFNRGEAVTDVSTRIGHAQKSTTLNIYSHKFKSSDTAIAEALNDEYF